MKNITLGYIGNDGQGLRCRQLYITRARRGTHHADWEGKCNLLRVTDAALAAVATSAAVVDVAGDEAPV